MKIIKIFVFLLITLAVMQGCNTKESEYNTIKTNIQAFNKSPDKARAETIHISIEEYTKKYPNDTLLPELYFDDSRFLINPLANYPKAITQLENIYKKYPDHRITPLALQLLAFTYDETLKDYKKAAETYQILIDKYPNHPAAKEAAILIKYLGKDLSEIIKAGGN